MRPVLALLALPLIALAGCHSRDVVQSSATTAPAPIAQTPTSDFILPAPQPGRLIDINLLKSVTRTLSSDAFEGRAPGTVGEEKTVSYLIAQMRKVGLKPGNKGSWTQDVPLVELTPSPDMTLRIAGAKTAINLAYKTDMVAGTYRVVPASTVAASDMVFVGYGINAPERGWNDYAGVDVRGKTVVILVNDPDYEMEGLDGPFEGRAMTYYGRWTYKYEEAARQGAAAALIVHETFPAAYPWDVVVSSWTGPQLNIDVPGDHMDQSAAAGWLTLDAAKRVFAAAGKDFAALSAAAKRSGFRAVPLGDLKASITINNTIRRQRSRNVIGILPGTSRPDDYVLYTAHWDHLGRCEPIDGDDICNGAVDNATGTAALIALAKAHRDAGPTARTLVFLAVTAEEAGLLGSAYYAENPVFPLARTVGGINMDALNMAGPTRDVVVIGGGKSELELFLERAVKDAGRVIKPEPAPEKGSFYRSDHFSFAKQGVPMLYAESGEDLVDGGVTAGQAAAEDYTVHRYHKPQDEYDPRWTWAGAASDLQLHYRIGRELAQSDVWPNWFSTAEFRTIRDESRSGANALK
ncbi:Zn-dependent M28 family amino/carboxypeptidase [Sphingobium sp. B7D2B]|uniref:M28 family metallopeptidase n=1 Tax=Sphingobium sp. B7D2B TaxID=2940583 RepID=UPI0022258E90|nr:M28 family metallopeptidase [Sphingobium sp. B7D2B]MCW2366802.1 Zn-dependent M28 family amino/carboxypeptidase [Sphingobium sp. B7D2B]